MDNDLTDILNSVSFFEPTNPNERLINAAIHGDVMEIDKARADGADINYRDTSIIGSSELCTALMETSWRMTTGYAFEHLLSLEGIDVDLGDVEGMNPLLKAVCAGYLSRVKMLDEAGANLEHRNADKESAVDLARMFKKTDVEDYLRARLGMEPRREPSAPKF